MHSKSDAHSGTHTYSCKCTDVIATLHSAPTDRNASPTKTYEMHLLDGCRVFLGAIVEELGRAHSIVEELGRAHSRVFGT
jgi:aminoglycoside phosphotransferase (APT) family kinase protein